MKPRRRECVFQVGAGFATALAYLDQQDVDKVEYTTRVIHAAYYRVITGELDLATIKNALNAIGGAPTRFSVSYRQTAARLVETVAAAHGVGVGEFVAAAILMAPSLHNRTLLEAKYIEENSGYDPSFLSDSFLRMWYRHRTGVASPLETQLLMLTKPLQIQAARLAAEVERLRVLVEEHLPVAQKSPPPKNRVAGATMEELKRIAAAWEIPIPNAAKIETVRRMVLQHFGYSSIIKIKRNPIR